MKAYAPPQNNFSSMASPYQPSHDSYKPLINQSTSASQSSHRSIPSVRSSISSEKSAFTHLEDKKSTPSYLQKICHQYSLKMEDILQIVQCFQENQHHQNDKISSVHRSREALGSTAAATPRDSRNSLLGISSIGNNSINYQQVTTTATPLESNVSTNTKHVTTSSLTMTPFESIINGHTISIIPESDQPTNSIENPFKQSRIDAQESKQFVRPAHTCESSSYVNYGNLSQNVFEKSQEIPEEESESEITYLPSYAYSTSRGDATSGKSSDAQAQTYLYSRAVFQDQQLQPETSEFKNTSANSNANVDDSYINEELACPILFIKEGFVISSVRNDIQMSNEIKSVSSNTKSFSIPQRSSELRSGECAPVNFQPDSAKVQESITKEKTYKSKDSCEFTYRNISQGNYSHSIIDDTHSSHHTFVTSYEISLNPLEDGEVEEGEDIVKINRSKHGFEEISNKKYLSFNNQIQDERNESAEWNYSYGQNAAQKRNNQILNQYYQSNSQMKHSEQSLQTPSLNHSNIFRYPKPAVEEQRSFRDSIQNDSLMKDNLHSQQFKNIVEYQQQKSYQQSTELEQKYLEQISRLVQKNEEYKAEIEYLNGKLQEIQVSKSDFEVIIAGLQENLACVTGLLRQKEEDFSKFQRTHDTLAGLLVKREQEYSLIKKTLDQIQPLYYAKEAEYNQLLNKHNILFEQIERQNTAAAAANESSIRKQQQDQRQSSRANSLSIAEKENIPNNQKPLTIPESLSKLLSQNKVNQAQNTTTQILSESNLIKQKPTQISRSPPITPPLQNSNLIQQSQSHTITTTSQIKSNELLAIMQIPKNEPQNPHKNVDNHSSHISYQQFKKLSQKESLEQILSSRTQNNSSNRYARYIPQQSTYSAQPTQSIIEPKEEKTELRYSRETSFSPIPHEDKSLNSIQKQNNITKRNPSTTESNRYPTMKRYGSSSQIYSQQKQPQNQESQHLLNQNSTITSKPASSSSSKNYADNYQKKMCATSRRQSTDERHVIEELRNYCFRKK